MKRQSLVPIIFILLSILFIQTVYGNNADHSNKIYLSEELNLSLKIENTIDIIPENQDHLIQIMNVYLSYVPMETNNQQITTLNTNPEAIKDNGRKKFQWEDIKTTRLAYKLEANINKKNNFQKIDSKEPFPIENINNSKSKYLSPTGTIDINEDIKNIANSLAEGEDDLYKVAHKLGERVNKNIEYLISEETEGQNQKASWVLDNKIGVCGEFTNLFIAMARSIGIPAKFISGYAYTNDPTFPENWNPHAWAEIYFPEHGWIPFDVTYGEMGYVGPTHIKLTEHHDSESASVFYEWNVKNAEVKTNPLSFNMDIIGIAKPVKPLLSIDTSILNPETSCGSYNILKININNPHNFYVPTQLMVSKTSEIEIFEGHRHFILMEPSSIQSLYLIMKTDENMEEGYAYSFRIDTKTKRNATDTARFSCSKNYPHYSLEEIRKYIEEMEKASKKDYSKNVTFTCEPNKKNFLLTDNARIICNIKNTGNVMLRNSKVCLQNDCAYIDMGISEKKNITFYHPILSTGSKRLEASFTHQELLKKQTIFISSFERPKLEITEVKAPENITFGKNFSAHFIVTRKNQAPIKNITASISGGGISQKWKQENIEEQNKYVVNVGRHVLTSRENIVNFTVTYTDERNRNYVEKKTATIKVTNLTIAQRSVMFANRVQEDIKNNTREMFFVIIGSFIVFLIIKRIIMGPSKSIQEYENIFQDNNYEKKEEELDEESGENENKNEENEEADLPKVEEEKKETEGKKKKRKKSKISDEELKKIKKKTKKRFKEFEEEYKKRKQKNEE